MIDETNKEIQVQLDDIQESTESIEVYYDVKYGSTIPAIRIPEP